MNRNRGIKSRVLLFIVVFLIVNNSFCQDISSSNSAPDSLVTEADTSNQKDAVDVLIGIFNSKGEKRPRKKHKLFVSLFPAVGSSPATGVAAVLASSISFYLHNKNTNISAYNISLAYTARNQLIFPIRSILWTRNNRWNLIGDWRYMIYNQETYGLGGSTPSSKSESVDFQYIRLYQYALRKLYSNLYMGGGVNYDRFHHIKDHLNKEGQSALTTYSAKGALPSSSIGMTVNVLWDNRKNSTTPEKGSYANLTYRVNVDQQQWQLMLLDLRKYMRLKRDSKNLLCFWFFTWATTNGSPPYLLLPSNCWDTYTSSGRGYAQGRFRGKKMLYFETEYRYAITRNGLLGGVVFMNASSFSEPSSEEFQKINPSIGTGLRVRLNKSSRTNLTIDFGFGQNGAYGIYFDVGEVF